MRSDARDAMRRPMRCELVAMQCTALRCTVRGLFAMQCPARGLVAFARCRRRHAFDGGIFRVGFFWVWFKHSSMLIRYPGIRLRRISLATFAAFGGAHNE